MMLCIVLCSTDSGLSVGGPGLRFPLVVEGLFDAIVSLRLAELNGSSTFPQFPPKEKFKFEFEGNPTN